jgi:hypothetical protein
VPTEFVTVTVVAPAVPVGANAATLVSERTAKLCALVIPKLTPVVKERPDPLIVTIFAPETGPLAGLREVIAGVVAMT